jgi:tetratricopeptide (TPR) repeat protein
MNKRRFTDAARQFQNVIGPMQSLAAIDPANQQYKKEQATALGWMADSQRALGNLDAAIELRKRQIAFIQQAMASGTPDVGFPGQLVIAHQGLGLLLMSRGKTDEGIAELRAAAAQADQLIPIEPTNTFWKSSAATARLWLANALLDAGRSDEARQAITSGCAIVSGIGQTDAVTTRRTACLVMRARLALATGDNRTALAMAENALASARQNHSEDPLKDRFTVAFIERLIGDSNHGLGNEGEARAAWAAALQAVPLNVPELPPEMDEHATILQRVGRSAEAQPIVSRLNAMGYKRSASGAGR